MIYRDYLEKFKSKTIVKPDYRKAEPNANFFGRPMKIWKGRPINLLNQFSSTSTVSKPLNAVDTFLTHRLSAWLRFALQRFIEPNRSNIHQP